MKALLSPKWISAAALLGACCNFTSAQEPVAPKPDEVLVSVADQRLVLLCDGGVLKKYRVSTSKFGTGDALGSYKTPLGKLRVCDKIGSDLDPGTVIKNRHVTGEIIPVNAPGRDPIVTRILWLEGMDDCNRNARTRGIYIHGTPEENLIGKPVSWGCIRMRSRDVIECYDEIPPGTPINIIADHLPKLHKYEPPKEVIIAEQIAKPEPPAAQVQPAPKIEDKPVVPTRSIATVQTVHESAATETKVIRADPGAANALKGSILLAGLSSLADPAVKPSQPVQASK